MYSATDGFRTIWWCRLCDITDQRLLLSMFVEWLRTLTTMLWPQLQLLEKFVLSESVRPVCPLEEKVNKSVILVFRVCTFSAFCLHLTPRTPLHAHNTTQVQLKVTKNGIPLSIDFRCLCSETNKTVLVANIRSICRCV